jgi:3-oxoacyl-[acyl-carrier protein] reductase
MVGGSGETAVSVFSGRFEGRTAVVTGAASGIGRDVARRLSARTSFFRIDKAMSSLLFVASAGRFTGYDPG